MDRRLEAAVAFVLTVRDWREGARRTVPRADWRIEDRTREFFAFFMLLVAGVYGVFLAVDTFVLFFFYELAIFPMYLLIATWATNASVAMPPSIGRSGAGA